VTAVNSRRKKTLVILTEHETIKRFEEQCKLNLGFEALMVVVTNSPIQQTGKTWKVL
jgi:hypothetical protein